MAASEPALRQACRDVAWLEPIDALRRLRQAGLQPLLLHSAGAHPEARQSVLAFAPLVEVRVAGRDVEERWADGAIEAYEADPMAALRALLDRFRFAVPPGQGFTGGWVGLLGFGLANALEPTLPAGHPSPTPDVLLRLCRDALVLDHATRRATLWASAPDGDAEAAQQRLEQALAALARPAAPGPAPEVGAWTASLDQPRFEAAVRELKRLVHHGDLFQANLATRFDAPFRGDATLLLERLAAANPSPYMAHLDFGDVAVISGSPEQLFASEGGRIRARPIAGTRKRGATPAEDAAMEAELLADEKEQAEHTMLVDLVRNDLARVAVAGTVRVAERGSVERYSHVMHLVSRVEAQLRPDAHIVDQVAANFPGGTVTGAPKARATQRILELEPVARGFYTGSAGWIGWDHSAHWSILIRTFVVQGGRISVHAGSGIVADSEPEREWKEANRKAQALREAATAAAPTGNRTRLGEVTAHGAWEPPQAMPRHAGLRVLLVDNFDSFVHNLADYASALGATVRVVRNDADWRAAVATFRPTHVILSPGPGWPDEAGCTLEVARELHGKTPLLGVCLGHQAIAQAFGGRVLVHPKGPVHGKSDRIEHTGAGLLAGLPSPLSAARYHSLVVEGLGRDWEVDARLADGTVMALRHASAPTFGLQFHPESLCTPRGLEILDRFLESRA